MLGGSLEDNVLTAIVWSETLAPQIALRIQVSDFSTQPYRIIAKAALDFLERHRRPARTHISDILEHDIRRGRDGEWIGQVVREMEERLAGDLHDAYVLSELDRFLEIQRLTAAVNSASDALREGKLAEARDILGAPDLLPRDNPGVWLHNTDDWLRFLRDGEEDETDLFSCGVEALDDRNVRPARGELFVMLAASGMGKSWFLINVGKQNVFDRKNVLHITLENSLEVTLERYTQCMLVLTRSESARLHGKLFSNRPEYLREGRIRDNGRTDQARLEPDLKPPDVESLRSLSRADLARRLLPFQRRGKLLVKHFPTGSLTMGMLVAYLDALEKIEGFKPDIILLDYLTMMRLDPDNLRISIGQLARNLRGLAEMRNFALVTVVQAQRAAARAHMVRGNMVAEDWSIVQTADTLVTYSQTAHEREKHRIARLLVEKARNTTDRWTAIITQSYEIGQFHLDSEYMTSELRNQLQEDTEDD